MPFVLDDETEMIGAAAQRLFKENFPREDIARFAETNKIQPNWRPLIGDSGFLGVCAPSATAGLGLGASAAIAIAQAAGRYCVPFPVSTGIVASLALADMPELSRKIIASEAIVAIAPSAQLNVSLSQGDIHVSGVVEAVAWADIADAVILETPDSTGEKTHLLVMLNDAGVRRQPRACMDPTTPVAQIHLHNVPAEKCRMMESRCRRLQHILAAAELCGASRHALEWVVDYMKLRRQFGQEIGRFQALKHIAATCAVHVENMALAVDYAAIAHDTASQDADEAANIAKAYTSDAARSVAEDAIQCHGGIGYTWDYGLHFLLRRILYLAATFGTAAEHREQILSRLIAEKTNDGGRDDVHDR